MSRWHRFLNTIGWRDLDPEIEEEIRFHIDSRIADNLSAGMSEAEARRDACARFGSRAAARENTRDTHGFVILESLRQDMTFAVRSLTRRPLFLLVAIATLALGMGATTAVFTLVRSVLLRPLPFPDPGRLYVITHAPQGVSLGQYPSMADTDYLAFREADRWFEATASFAAAPATLTGAGLAVRLKRTTVTPDFFRALGVAPALGRAFAPGDERKGNNHILVLSDAVWRDRFGADPGLVNRNIAVDGVEHRVVGIMPRGFHFPADTALWTPLAVETSANNTYFRPVIGRLRAGVPEGVAQRSFETLGRILTGQGRESVPSVSRLIPLKEAIVGDTSRPLLVFSAAVALVLLIACANVANLLLMRAVSRRQEIATRLALGAARGRVARQLLTESVMLSVGGGSAGMLLAWAAVPMLLTLMPPGRLPQDIEVRADLVVFVCAFLLSTATGLVLGVAPALQASRRELSATLREGGSPTRRSYRLRHALVIGEIALSFVLLVGAGLLLRSFANLRSVKTGFDPTNVITMTIDLPDPRYPDRRALAGFHDQLLASIARIPGVLAPGAVNWLPLGDMLIGGDFTTDRGIGGRATKPGVSPGYFRVMGISLLSGRDFTADDQANAPGVAIVSESVARQAWPGETAIGRRVSLEDNPRPQDWLTVVGVVSDIRQGGVREPAVPAIYQPLGQVTRAAFLSHMTFVARTADNPQRIAPAMRAALSEVDRDQAPLAVATMEQVLMGTIADTTFQTRLLGAFSCVALVLAAIGIYGVLASSVVERTREIGIRLALGAGKRAVVRMVLWRTLLLAVAGVLLGLTGAYATTQVLTSFLFDVTATDRATLLAAAGTLLAVALIAGLVPARHASTVDPLTALRTL